MRRSEKEVEACVASLATRCRAKGLPLTPQRVTIYRVLLESFDHPSPEALYERVKSSMPSISLATIYKTLDTLVALKVASEIPSTTDTKRYDANMRRHHHLVCTRCDRVEDHDDVALAGLKLPKPVRGFKPEFLSIHIHGLCNDCSVKARA